jgi:hypothetical protein
MLGVFTCLCDLLGQTARFVNILLYPAACVNFHCGISQVSLRTTKHSWCLHVAFLFAYVLCVGVGMFRFFFGQEVWVAGVLFLQK